MSPGRSLPHTKTCVESECWTGVYFYLLCQCRNSGKNVKIFDELKFRVLNLNFSTLLPAEVSDMALFYPSPLSLFWKASLEGPRQM